MFTDVTREAAASATADIKKREAELVDEFKKKGLQIVNVDRKSFVDAVLKNAPARVAGLRQGRLRPDRRASSDAAAGRAAASRRMTHDRRRRARPRRRGPFPRDRRADRPVRLRLGGLAHARLLLAAGARHLLPVLHALRARELGRVDRGDRALPADHRDLRRRVDGGAAEHAHPRRVRLPLAARPASAGRCRPASTSCAWRSSAYATWLSVAAGAEDAEPADDRRRLSDELHLRLRHLRLRDDDLPRACRWRCGTGGRAGRCSSGPAKPKSDLNAPRSSLRSPPPRGGAQRPSGGRAGAEGGYR